MKNMDTGINKEHGAYLVLRIFYALYTCHCTPIVEQVYLFCMDVLDSNLRKHTFCFLPSQKAREHDYGQSHKKSARYRECLHAIAVKKEHGPGGGGGGGGMIPGDHDRPQKAGDYKVRQKKS